jgi:HAD superfamily hydrolase (TIGR01662 family)
LLTLFDLGSTLMYHKDQWEPLFLRADAVLWESLRDAGVSIAPSDLYGDYDTLFNLYYSQHRGDVDEPTTYKVLNDLLVRKGFNIPDLVLRRAIRNMYRITQSNWFPEPEAIDTLQTIKEMGKAIGLISNAADDENTQDLIDRGGFRRYVDYIISSAAFGKRKPHPGIFQAALDYFQMSPENAVMIGDTYEADITGGKQAGMQTIWIIRRVQGVIPRLDPPPDAIVSNLSEIPALLS